eukprot:scaffold2462_cov127-Cylindrotheca_fusiformis.AAC.14
MPPLHYDFLAPASVTSNHHRQHPHHADHGDDHNPEAPHNNRAAKNKPNVASSVEGYPSAPPATAITTSSSLDELPEDSADGTTRKGNNNNTKIPVDDVNHAKVAARQLYKIWAKLTVPVVLLSFFLTQSIPFMLVSSLLPFSIAFVQGAMRMLTYRVRYSKAPVPMAPARGVVQCTSLQDSLSCLEPSGGDCEGDSSTMETTTTMTPLRLLLIGDSLAVGVGQSTSSTPIMPEAIAKELSKEMNGRPVMWTCHGAPGASTGWIIRELERSIQNGGHFFQQPKPQTERTPSSSSSQHHRLYDTVHPEQEYPMEVDLSADSFSSCDSYLEQHSFQQDDEEMQQPSHSEPQDLAPFDIAVVLTGSNDLKNACLPFLVKKDDDNLDGVSKRVGDYGKELQKLLAVLQRQMKLQLQTLKDSVEAATERVRESVDTVVDRTLGRGESLSSPTPTPQRSSSSDDGGSSATSFAEEQCNEDECSPISNLDSAATVATTTSATSSDTDQSSSSDPCETSRLLNIETTASSTTDDGQASLFPMVVLPGMPADALPAFDMFPLRHLAVPMVNIMDGHKRNLANQHDGEVLFVDAPSPQDIAEYSRLKGMYWKQQEDDDVIVNTRDIEETQRQRIEDKMNEYYEHRRTSYDSNPPNAKRHFSTISEDGVHPNDHGYNFWGRYLGNAIVQEWRKKKLQLQKSPHRPHRTLLYDEAR